MHKKPNILMIVTDQEYAHLNDAGLKKQAVSERYSSDLLGKEVMQT